MESCRKCITALNPLPGHKPTPTTTLTPLHLDILFSKYITQLGQCILEQNSPHSINTNIRIRRSLKEKLYLLVYNDFIPNTELMPFNNYDDAHTCHLTTSIECFAIRTYLTHKRNLMFYCFR